MTQDFSHFMEIIESQEFRFIANQAAGLRAFKRIVEEQEVFPALIQFASDKSGGLALLKRILELTSRNVDESYEHPDDTALAVYLLGLDAAASEYAQMASYLALSVSRIWWSRKIAAAIVTRSSQKSQPSVTKQETVQLQKAHYSLPTLTTTANDTLLSVFPLVRAASNQFSDSEIVKAGDSARGIKRIEIWQ